MQVPSSGPAEIALELQRWINPREHGYYSGDHHIHAAGCAHYTSPTEGVTPEDMFRQVQGEGLNVGCVLTWGPCYEFQRQFFSPQVKDISQPLTILKYDLEISGFGSQALGHVCLLNLRDQTFPGSQGTKTAGWPTWTTPVLRWAKEQGGVTGYAHSASGLAVNPQGASQRLMQSLDAGGDGVLSKQEGSAGLLPESFELTDANRDGLISIDELVASHDRVADRLPNLAIPEMNGVGAMEVAVSTAAGVCDFISAMDTARVAEWNCWYHLLNCGFPLKVSGETDFPCMSSTRVGQGRVYVKLGNVDRVDFTDWCRGIAEGRSYVSDGYAHALDFKVNDAEPGGEVSLNAAGQVDVQAKVAFAPETPQSAAQGLVVPPAGRRVVGDTVELHGPRFGNRLAGGSRRVEIIVNGHPVTQQDVPADGDIHELQFSIPIAHSSWVALRQFPQLHTNPVNVVVAGKPIRASRASALWCIGMIEQLWRARSGRIAEAERAAAEQAFRQAIDRYRQIAEQSHDKES
ncbi:MAG: CehA/McbA family metallohydrolase [Planctomycetes bacterium]|nr:CehA/McbA family metallohydrolase [Planctomycetota bacterium]